MSNEPESDTAMVTILDSLGVDGVGYDEVYQDFAEELYSRTEATPIDQGIIDLLDQRPGP